MGQLHLLAVLELPQSNPLEAVALKMAPEAQRVVLAAVVVKTAQRLLVAPERLVRATTAGVTVGLCPLHFPLAAVVAQEQ
jgi:hypothetical protein